MIVIKWWSNDDDQKLIHTWAMTILTTTTTTKTVAQTYVNINLVCFLVGGGRDIYFVNINARTLKDEMELLI